MKIGLAGCGYAARTRHLPALQRIPDAEVVAVADLDPRALADLADGRGIPRRYAATEDLLADPAVEVVAICVPADAHVGVALAALEAGKHVLVEKPLALSLDEADRVIERARRSPSKLTMGFNLRAHGLVRRARDAVARGAIGPVRSIRTAYTDSVLDRPGLPAWRMQRTLGGGALLEKAVHHFDLWRFLTGDEPEDVFAVGRSQRADDDSVCVTARMRRGALATALVDDATAIGNELRLYGEAGALDVCCYRFDGLRRSSLTDLPGAPRTRLRRGAAALGDLAANARAVTRGGVFDVSYEAQWRHFIRAIRADEAPISSLDDGRRALQIALAALHSAATGNAVPVEAAPRDISSIAQRGGCDPLERR